MANAYSKIFLHLVFSPWNKEYIIPQNHKEELHKYTTGIIQNRQHILMAINFMPDHVHILIGYKPVQPIPDLVRDIKANTSKFINEMRWLPGNFRWQRGYAVFSCGYSQVNTIIRYIQTQEEHHRKNSFREEYLKHLKDNDIDYDPRYLFEWQ